MNWKTVITGEGFENWITTKLSPHAISQGARLDPFATSMRDFKAASNYLVSITDDGKLPPRGGNGAQVRTDLSAADIVTSGNTPLELTTFGKAVFKEWKRVGVLNSLPTDELTRCVIVMKIGINQKLPLYTQIYKFWLEIMDTGVSFENVIQNPTFLYLVSFLNSDVSGFNPWLIAQKSDLEIHAASLTDINAIKSRYPLQEELLDKLTTRVQSWASRSGGRKTFCAAIQLLAVTPLERNTLLAQMKDSPDSYVGDFDKNIIENALGNINLLNPISLNNPLKDDLCSEDVGLRFPEQTPLLLTSSLLSKPFLILTGLSGSGKTKLAQAFTKWITPAPDTEGKNPYVALVPVGADWMGNENILGYPDGLNDSNYISKKALELIIHANDNPEAPHFLILDEMNLSHVERYFADILSAIESGEDIPLYQGAVRKSGGKDIPRDLKFPPNLFVIGTVNVDETTYMFSPKVLDRANVIEFRMEPTDLSTFLDTPVKPDLEKLAGEGKDYGKDFVAAAKVPSYPVPKEIKPLFDEEMKKFFEVLAKEGTEFGYRTAYEAGRFLHFYQQLGEYEAGDKTWFDSAFDAIIIQKFLPKLHGSSGKLNSLLNELLKLCQKPQETTLDPENTDNSEEQEQQTDAEKAATAVRYPMSSAKLERIIKVLNRNGFVSFAEA